ncbi:uncharacterized protein LOC115632370 [Scaptodrosophila lebanonensis]|uniref:Uncharacterized protein LOC115632370 n=1 Tax=Drosophila lebanonensis TaxID=7225 RepID=A0A6J2UAI0_DROLE|nr:uncharacterized protein LOC115632370 [Scaptodrosophila lebanonensis]
MTLVWRPLLFVVHCIQRILYRCCSRLSNEFVILVVFNLMCLIAVLDYNWARHDRDLMYWQHEIREHICEFLLTMIVLLASVHVVLSCIDVTILSALVRRKLSHFEKPRIYFELQYRRYIFMRMVHKLELALQLQHRYADGDSNMVDDLHRAQQLIRKTIDEFRAATHVLLWPNQTDLELEPYVLYNIDELNLELIDSLGYGLSRVELNDVTNDVFRSLLNPNWY